MVEHNQSTYNGGQYDNAYKFNGKEVEESTQMYYYGARYYDPRISIFVSVDPLAEKYRGIGGYVYVANNPINLIDPNGMEIVNADRKRLASHQGRYNNYKKTSDYQKYSSLTRKEAKKQFGNDGLSKWETVQSTIKDFDKNISKYQDRADKTDAIIAKWKTTSPNLYKKIDEMKVDFYLGVDEGVQDKAFGTTGGPTQFKDKFNYRVDDLNIRNALPVFINSGVNIDSIDEETGEYSLNHEAGHFIFAVEDPALYLQDKETIGPKDYNGGHHSDANTGKAAREYGRKKDIE